MRAARLLALVLTPPIAGCATFPVLDASPEPAAAQADYPVLLPIDTILAQVPPEPETDPAAALMARAAALKARAAALQQVDLSG